MKGGNALREFPHAHTVKFKSDLWDAFLDHAKRVFLSYVFGCSRWDLTTGSAAEPKSHCLVRKLVGVLIMGSDGLEVV